MCVSCLVRFLQAQKKERKSAGERKIIRRLNGLLGITFKHFFADTPFALCQHQLYILQAFNNSKCGRAKGGGEITLRVW